MDAERVEAQWLEDRVPLESLESSIHVVPCEGEQVPDVQPFGRWVREHHQGVERTHSGDEVGVVGAAHFPTLLPFPLDGGRIVSGSFLGRCWTDRFCHGDREI